MKEYEKTFGIYGASGFGREVLPIAKKSINSKNNKLVFVDDGNKESFCNGIEVVSFDDFLNINAKEKFIAIAIAENEIRKVLSQKCINSGIKSWSLSASNIVVLDNVKIGEGSILCPFVTLTTDIEIGKYFHANIYSYVAHDCVIGDYVTFAPSVKCNGNVVIEDNVYIGTGAIIKQGRSLQRPLLIGQGAVIAAGAVVTKNVPAGVTVIGNPAKPLTRENLKKR